MEIHGYEEAEREAQIDGPDWLREVEQLNREGIREQSSEEYDKGGYEVLWSNLVYFPYHGCVMPFNRDTAKRLTEKIVKGWKN